MSPLRSVRYSDIAEAASSQASAISFIETMDASGLSDITQAEFEANVEQAIASLPPGSPHDAKSPRSPSGRAPHATGLALSSTAEGEEPARALTNLPANIALDTRRFFQRTGELASGAVGRPLSALGRLIDGIATGTNSEDDSAGEASGDGDGDDRDREHRGSLRTPLAPIPYRARVRSPGVGDSPAGGGWLGASPGRPSGLAPGVPDSPYNQSRRCAMCFCLLLFAAHSMSPFQLDALAGPEHRPDVQPLGPDRRDRQLDRARAAGWHRYAAPDVPGARR